jgi:hypothetical protein
MDSIIIRYWIDIHSQLGRILLTNHVWPRNIHLWPLAHRLEVCRACRVQPFSSALLVGLLREPWPGTSEAADHNLTAGFAEGVSKQGKPIHAHMYITYIYIFIYLFIHLFIYSFIYLVIYLCIYLCIYVIYYIYIILYYIYISTLCIIYIYFHCALHIHKCYSLHTYKYVMQSMCTPFLWLPKWIQIFDIGQLPEEGPNWCSFKPWLSQTDCRMNDRDLGNGHGPKIPRLLRSANPSNSQRIIMKSSRWLVIDLITGQPHMEAS